GGRRTGAISPARASWPPPIWAASPERRRRGWSRANKGGCMAGKAKFVFIASMDIDPAKEALFNEVYDTEHVPELLKVPGVLSIRRAVSVPLTMFIGGEKKTIVAEGEPRYSAYYELESAEVLTQDLVAAPIWRASRRRPPGCGR